MNERFTLEYTVTEITENERVSRKLPFFFDMALCEQLKWPFHKMKLKHMMKLVRFPAQELVTAANFILERRAAADMGRAIRFLRANHQKLGIDPERIALLACGSACTGAEELNRLRDNIEDVTHRYDGIRPYPDGTWTDHDSGGLEHERLAQLVRELKDGEKE